MPIQPAQLTALLLADGGSCNAAGGCGAAGWSHAAHVGSRGSPLLVPSLGACVGVCIGPGAGAFIYGGPLVPGHCDPPLRDDVPPQYHRGLDAGSVVEASGSFAAGLIDLEELHRIECDAMPRSGT